MDYDERTSREEIKREIIILQKSLKEKTSSSTTERAKSFAKKHLYELDRLISQAKEIGVSDDTIKQLYEARGNLDETSDVEQIIREVKHLISVTAKFEETKSERIKSRINQLETKYDRLSNHENSGEYDLDSIRPVARSLPEAGCWPGHGLRGSFGSAAGSRQGSLTTPRQPPTRSYRQPRGTSFSAPYQS